MRNEATTGPIERLNGGNSVADKSEREGEKRQKDERETFTDLHPWNESKIRGNCRTEATSAKVSKERKGGTARRRIEDEDEGGQINRKRDGEQSKTVDC